MELREQTAPSHPPHRYPQMEEYRNMNTMFPAIPGALFLKRVS